MSGLGAVWCFLSFLYMALVLVGLYFIVFGAGGTHDTKNDE